MERFWLTGTLWPDSDEGAALANLRSSLKDLRRALGPEADRLRSPTPQTLSLDLTGAYVDVLALDQSQSWRVGDPATAERHLPLARGLLNVAGRVPSRALTRRCSSPSSGLPR